MEEKLKLAVFIDFDNIQIGVKDTLGKEFDVSLVLEALKERGEVVAKVAYGDWHRAGDQSRQMTQHAVQLVQRNVTPRGDKNGADINLALDALEMAFTRHHINTFVIVGGDSDFVTLVEKLKQYDKRVFVVGGRAFTSQILQRNSHEFLAYENLLKPASGARAARSARAPARSLEARPLSAALATLERAMKILAEREVAPQLGLLKSTLLQLDPTFSERDYGASTFLEFMQKMEQANLVRLRRSDRSYLVEPLAGDGKAATDAVEDATPAEPGEAPADAAAVEPSASPEDALPLVRQAVTAAREKSPNRPLYLRQVRQALRAIVKDFDERRYGFRGLLDLLHEVQREGLIRMQRDRNGVWRVFPVLPSSEAVAGAPTLTEVTAEDSVVAVTELAPVAEESEARPEAALERVESVAGEATVAEEPPPIGEETPPVEPAPEPKPRKGRAARAPRRAAARRPASRRKPE